MDEQSVRKRAPGPGRRPLPEAERKRKYTIWFTPQADRELEMVRRPGESVSETLQRALTYYSQSYDPADRP